MNTNICKIIIDNKKQFIPYLFTNRQISILQRYVNKKPLTNTEKTYLYSSIKRKIDPLTILKEEYHITGNNMIPERVTKAKSILKNIKEKAFISGSYLYNKKSNDIDIYIISNKRKQYKKNKKHYIFITEKDLKKPLFLSALKYSVSNSFIKDKTPEIKKPTFNDLTLTYEMIINEILDNDDQKIIREIVFEYYLQTKSKILDSLTLAKKTNAIIKLEKQKKIELVNKITRELLHKLYSKKYMYNILPPFIKQIKKTIKEYPAHENLKIYTNFLTEIKNECRTKR